ncbi:MAG: universal stress protein [Rubrivivax sp.]|nr:MAG: universal stress protein [Rubrivivax sp.]
MKILVAVDGSPAALDAVQYAASLLGQLVASPSNAITLVSVHDDAGLRHAKAVVGADAVADYLRELSERDLDAARKLLDEAGIRHDMVIRSGHVAQQIVECAKAGGFDLIVLGAKGRGAIVDVLLGSVAQRVLATAAGPVLLVK